MKNVEDIEITEQGNEQATVKIKSDSAFLKFRIALMGSTTTPGRVAYVTQADMKLDTGSMGAVAKWVTKLTRSRAWQMGNGEYESASRLWTVCGEAIDNFFNT